LEQFDWDKYIVNCDVDVGIEACKGSVIFCPDFNKNRNVDKFQYNYKRKSLKRIRSASTELLHEGRYTAKQRMRSASTELLHAGRYTTKQRMRSASTQLLHTAKQRGVFSYINPEGRISNREE
jgi:hypothetical protein